MHAGTEMRVLSVTNYESSAAAVVASTAFHFNYLVSAALAVFFMLSQSALQWRA